MTNEHLKKKLAKLKTEREEKEEKEKLEAEIKKEERKKSHFWNVIDGIGDLFDK